jgi:hypothetical protein
MSTEQQNLGFSGMMQYLGSLKRSVSHAAAFLLAILRRYWWLILLGSVLCGAWKWYAARNRQPYYDVRMCCTFNDNHQKIFGEMTTRLNQLLQQGSRKEVARLLELPEDKVARIASIEALTLAHGKLEDDFSETHLPFYIDARVYDREIVPELEKSILRYLNNNDLSQRDLVRKRQKWTARIDFYRQQLMKLDSLKESIRLSYAVSNNHTAPVTDNAVADIYRISDSMAFNMEDFNYYLDHYATVSSIYGFAAADYPSTPELKPAVTSFASGGFILSWLLLAGIVLVRQAPGKQNL